MGAEGEVDLGHETLDPFVLDEGSAEGQELERALRGQDADGLRERRRSQYSDFIRTRLLQRIPLGTTGRVSI